MSLQEKITSLFVSRRFQAAIAGMIVVVLHEQFGLPEETATNIVYIIMAWIVGDSITKTK